jgi:hypothetical protein
VNVRKPKVDSRDRGATTLFWTLNPVTCEGGRYAAKYPIGRVDYLRSQFPTTRVSDGDSASTLAVSLK